MLRIAAYHRPPQLEDAVALLAEDGRTIIAGGTDLLVNPRYMVGIREVVDIASLGLDYLIAEDGLLRIGAGATMRTVARSPIVQALAAGILASGAAVCGSPNIRNMATLAGNIASALPSADTPPPLLALDAVVLLAGRAPTGVTYREVPLDRFFLGPARSVRDHELIVEVRIPLPPHIQPPFENRCGTSPPGLSLGSSPEAGRGRRWQVPCSFSLADGPVISSSLGGKEAGRGDLSCTLAIDGQGHSAEAGARGSSFASAAYGQAQDRLAGIIIHGGYYKIGRTAEDIAIVNAAVALTMRLPSVGARVRSRQLADTSRPVSRPLRAETDTERGPAGEVLRARIAVGAVAPTPLRVRSAEQLLEGQILDEHLIQRAAAAAMEEARPISDHRASADYRRRMTGVAVARALRRAAGWAPGGEEWHHA
jgi:CO/xanthine dehydrogenase FAD-binding subunit